MKLGSSLHPICALPGCMNPVTAGGDICKVCIEHRETVNPMAYGVPTSVPTATQAGTPEFPRIEINRAQADQLNAVTNQKLYEPEPSQDNWAHRSIGMKCLTCMWFVAKANGIGRCRRHSPAPSGGGWPVVYQSDWCGDHKLDEKPK